MSQAPTQELSTQEAWASKDVKASIAAHERAAEKVPAAVEQHRGSSGEYVKSVVFGGLDGIVTTFSLIAAAVGANLSVDVIVTLGFANLIADAIAMGLGDYISEKAEIEYVRSEQAREKWELDNYPEGEKKEMIDIYKDKYKMSEEDANELIEIFARYPEAFLDLMMVEELELLPPDSDPHPMLNGLVTFTSFTVCGVIPLIVYVIARAAHYADHSGLFGVAIAATAVTIFLLGAFKGLMSRLPWWRQGFYTLCVGGTATAVAYLVGYGLERAFNVHQSS